MWVHISDHDLELYHLGRVSDAAQLDRLEGHLLACPTCAERAEECAAFVDAIQTGIIDGGYCGKRGFKLWGADSYWFRQPWWRDASILDDIRLLVSG